ncbi:MAG: heme ABC exporter ATP-binding protein CcmA [Alsobacter sp.]
MRLVVEGLACERSGRPVFEGLSFAASAGTAIVLLGPNGAGKSSPLAILAGLLEAPAGVMRLEGGDPEASLGEQAHYLGHRDAVKPALTPRETLDIWRALLGSPQAMPAAALERLGLGHAADLPCAYLSAGQRRRLALARLLVSRRPLWLLDEPTAALDHASRRVFADLVAEHLAAGGIAVAATHIPLGIDGAVELHLGRPA